MSTTNNTTKKSRPGVMFYFSWCSAFEDMTATDTRAMVLAIINYGKTGEVPEFKKKNLQALWRMIQPQIDRDQERYEQAISQRQAAARKRWAQSQASAQSDMDQYMNW